MVVKKYHMKLHGMLIVTISFSRIFLHLQVLYEWIWVFACLVLELKVEPIMQMAVIA